MNNLFPVQSVLMRIGILSCIFYLAIPHLQAQTAGNRNNQALMLKPTVDSAAGTLMATTPTTGLSIGIYKNGQTATFNYGETAKGNYIRPTANTIYAIASISKTFTGILLAQAVQEKRLRLEDDIREYLDAPYPNLEYKGHPIRLKYLTNHRSGLPFLMPDIPETMSGYHNDSIPWATRLAGIYKNYSREDFYADLHRVTLDTMPGATVKYSNAAAQLLCYILEKKYNRRFETLLREKITGPLQMSSTGITLSGQERSRFVNGYDQDGRRMPYVPDTLLGAASIKSTVNDMLKYIRWNVAEKEDVIRLSHANILEANGPYGTGLNWQELAENGQMLIWQSGNVPGFQSFCVLYPRLDMGIIVLSNESGRTLGSRLQDMINAIAKAADPRSLELP